MQCHRPAGVPGQNGDYVLMSPSPSPAPSPAALTPGGGAARGTTRPPHARSASDGGAPRDRAEPGVRLGFATPGASPREPAGVRPAASGSPAALARAAEARRRSALSNLFAAYWSVV